MTTTRSTVYLYPLDPGTKRLQEQLICRISHKVCCGPDRQHVYDCLVLFTSFIERQCVLNVLCW